MAFTNDRGYALGHNPNAPSPFVTWTFYENADGSRDYNWGHYFKDEEAAVRDFAHRAAECHSSNYLEPFSSVYLDVLSGSDSVLVRLNGGYSA